MIFFDISTVKVIDEVEPPVTSDEAKIAWMAGLFEGEGCIRRPISRTANRGYYSGFGLDISMTDLDVLEQFADFAGGGRIDGPLKPNGLGKKMYYKLRIRNNRAYFLLERMWPWLNERRKGQALKALMAWSVMGQTKHGCKIKPEDIPYIKEELRKGGHGVNRRLAREFGVTDAMISAIKKGRAWKD